MFQSLLLSSKERKLKKQYKEDIQERTQTAAGLNQYLSELAQSNLPEDEFCKKKADAVIEYCKNMREKKDKKKNTYEKMHQQVFKCAAKAASYYSENQVDSELFKKINNLISLSDRYSYYNKAKETQDLINYTIWKVTDREAIGLSTLSRDQKMFINGVCQELHADLIYPDLGALDLKQFDPWIVGWKGQRYLLKIDNLKALVTTNFQDAINKAMNPFIAAVSSLKSPIKFNVASPNKNNTLVDPDKEVDSYNLNLLEDAIRDYFTEERQYRFELGSTPNTYKLVALNPNNNIWEEFRLNIGYYGRDVVSILCENMFGQIICIHPKCTELWQKVLGNCFYRLTDIETNIAAAAVSQYFWLYNSVDMSTISEDEIINNLDIKLNYIFNDLQFNGIILSSYKFEKYNGVNDFIMNGIDGSVIIASEFESCYRLGQTYRSVKN